MGHRAAWVQLWIENDIYTEKILMGEPRQEDLSRPHTRYVYDSQLPVRAAVAV